MKTFLIETLELSNFGHMTTSRILLMSCDKILLVTLWTKIMMSLPLFQNTFVLRKLRVANFVDIIIIATINYVFKWNLYLYFLISSDFQ